MINAVISFIARAWGYVVTYFLARSMAKKKEAENAVKANEARNEIDDNIRKSDFSSRRLRLGKWSVRGISPDKADRP